MPNVKPPPSSLTAQEKRGKKGKSGRAGGAFPPEEGIGISALPISALYPQRTKKERKAVALYLNVPARGINSRRGRGGRLFELWPSRLKRSSPSEERETLEAEGEKEKERGPPW